MDMKLRFQERSATKKEKYEDPSCVTGAELGGGGGGALVMVYLRRHRLKERIPQPDKALPSLAH